MNNKINNDGLVLELPIKFCMVTYMHFEQKCGEHAEIIIKGILDSSEKIKNAYAMNLKDTLILRKNGKILFSGVPTYVSVKSHAGLMNVIVKGKSRSILLDVRKEKKSFQKKQTYYSLLREVIGNDGILTIQENLKDKEKSQVAVQYKETDWEFMKRMASHMYAPVCPNISIGKTGVYIGFPQGNSIDEEVSTYKIKKNLSEYQKYHVQDTSAHEKDFMALMFQSHHFTTFFK